MNEDVTRLLVHALPENERLVVCGTAVDPTVRDILRELQPGSTVRKIPQSILQEYRQETRWGKLDPFDAALHDSDTPAAEEVRA